MQMFGTELHSMDLRPVPSRLGSWDVNVCILSYTGLWFSLLSALHETSRVTWGGQPQHISVMTWTNAVC